MTRTCKRCNITFEGPLDENFYSSSNYFEHTCKKCRKQMKREIWNTNQEYRERQSTQIRARWINDYMFRERWKKYARDKYKSDITYQERCKENNKRRQRERYANDPAFREKAIARARARYFSGRPLK